MNFQKALINWRLFPFAQRVSMPLQLNQTARVFSTYEDRKNLKFSAFNSEDQLPKDYSVKDEWKKRLGKLPEPFVPKPEVERIPFNPNIRHRLDEIPNDLIYRGIDVLPPRKDPQSCYLSVVHKGQRYHLFNAAYIPLGRMARMCAVLMRGKNKPTFNSQMPLQGDICVVVNAANPMIGGKKKQQKQYRHHTQYFSGFKEINMEKLLLKDPAKVIYFAIKGMIPKNKHREDLLRKMLIVHAGPHHSQYAQMLPQFTEAAPIDINEYYSLNKLEDKEAFAISYTSDPDNIPEEIAHLDRLDKEEDHIPITLRDKPEFTKPKENLFRSFAYKNQHKHMKRWKN